MALISLRQLLDHAAENDYGVAAFNVNNMEQIQAIMEAAEETDRVITRDHYDPKKRHYQVIPRNPWNRPEFREGGLRLGRILDADVYQQEVHPPEVQREYTQRQARGMPKREYTRAARHNYR